MRFFPLLLDNAEEPLVAEEPLSERRIRAGGGVKRSARVGVEIDLGTQSKRWCSEDFSSMPPVDLDRGRGGITTSMMVRRFGRRDTIGVPYRKSVCGNMVSLRTHAHASLIKLINYLEHLSPPHHYR